MDELIKQLKFEEGLRLKTYTDPVGVATIGYGHNLTARPYHNGKPIPHEITEALAEDLLERDAHYANECLHAAWHGIGLLQGARHDACVAMVFQLGLDGFMGFKEMRKQLAVGDWHGAFKSALDSKWAKQTPNRARRVALQFITGEYYEA